MLPKFSFFRFLYVADLGEAYKKGEASIGIKGEIRLLFGKNLAK